MNTATRPPKPIAFSCLHEFTSLMAILLQSSLNLKDALDIVVRSSERREVRELARATSEGMERGRAFLPALCASGSLPPVYSGLIRVGEKTGELSKAYQRLADYLGERKKLIDGLKGAMAYPILILCVASLGGAGVALFALPKLREVFSELGGSAAAELDAGIAGAMRSSLILLSLMALAALAWIVAALVQRRNPAAQLALDGLRYRLPFFGKIEQSRCLLEFSFAMEAMVAGGIPLDEAMREASLASANAYFSKAVLDARELTRKGRSLSAACAALSAFPAYMTQWLAVGERTGKPHEIFGRLRAYYQAMAERRGKALLSLIEPSASLLIGAGVLYLVFTFVIPLFKAMGSLINLQ